MRLSKLLFLISLTLISFSANAVDLDFYTYGGFEVTVNAFTRVALIFNDGEYIVMFFVAVLFGIFFGGLITAGNKLLNSSGGNDASIFNFVILVMIGVALFKALIIPKGNIHVYDPVVNRYQMISDVPDLIVVAAGVTNKAERVLTEIMDSGSSHPRTLQGNGVGLELLLNSFAGRPIGHEAYLQKSVNQYISSCLPPAESLSTYTFDLQQLKSNTSNIMSELAKIKSPSVFTVVYSNAHKEGVSLSCTEAWDTVISPALSNGALFDEYVEQICSQSTFAVNDASIGAAQAARCKIIIEDAQDLIFDPNITGDYNLFMRNIMLSKSLVDALSETPGSAIRMLANKDLVTGGIASQMISEEWLPAIKAVVFGVVLGLMPIIALFIVTPLVFKSVHIMLGLLLWVALWGVTDAMVHGIAMDQIISMSQGSVNKGMSLDALLLLPDQAAKGLAILGKAQSMGVILATFIAGVFFRISGYAFTQLSEKWQQDIDRFGDKAGQEALDPVSNTDAIKRNMDSQSMMGTMGYMGMDSFAVANQSMISAPYSQHNAQVKSLTSSGMSNTQATMHSGDFYGGERAGEILQQNQYANENFGGMTSHAAVQHAQKRTDTELSSMDGQYQGFKDISTFTGKDVSEVISDNAQTSQVKSTLENQSYKDDVLAVNPGMSFVEASRLDRSAVTTNETSSNRAINERLKGMSEISGADRYHTAIDNQLIKTSDEFGKFYATKGDHTPYDIQAALLNEKSLGHTHAEESNADDRGLSFWNLGEMQGRKEVLDTVGDNRGINRVSEETYIDGKDVTVSTEALRGEVEMAKAEERNILLSSQLIDKAITEEAERNAETQARFVQEGATGLPTDDLMLARELTRNTEFSLSEEKAAQVLTNTDISDSATAAVLTRGGMVDLKFDEGGNVVSSRGYSGSSGTKDDSQSSISGLKLKLGDQQEESGSIANAIQNRDFDTRDEYQRLFSGMYTDPSVRESVLSARAQELNEIMHSTLTYQDLIGHRENIEARVGTPGLFDEFSPVSAEISAMAYTEGQITDQDTHSAHQLALESLYNKAIEDADEWRDSYMDVVKNAPPETYQAIHENYASTKFAEYERAYTDAIKEAGHKKLRGLSDHYKENAAPDNSDIKIPDMKNIK
ncbi:conjugal transfer protein TraG N-terminal domain-containing protein [Pseudoalteromonas galatheae]|uniref:conjugal transfer protein TraG N-terminal domain-containing protein n=1 Tax=Pseudoalteromonas galatheae TaxID=579562 RepID=UPI0030D3D108